MCDNDASDADRGDGVIVLATVVPGDYTLRETRSPVGYLPSADRITTIRADQRTQVTIADVRGPVPEQTGEVRIFKVDAVAERLPARALPCSTELVMSFASACDAADGADDGTVQIEDPRLAGSPCGRRGDLRQTLPRRPTSRSRSSRISESMCGCRTSFAVGGS